MLAKVYTCSLHGIDGYPVQVEVDISPGLPGFEVVGLPDSAVKESKDRVRTAIKNSGFEFPVKKITVNLAPADTKKEGASYDLPIALAILAATEIIPSQEIAQYFIAGELSLDGSVKAVKGMLSMAYGIYHSGVHKGLIPIDNREEAGIVPGFEAYGVSSLKEAVAFLLGEYPIDAAQTNTVQLFEQAQMPLLVDFADVKGQENVKRALEIAAAGLHNIVIIGPPGSGKTMMAKRLPTILPDLTFEESIEITKIYSISELIQEKNGLILKRPFRAPHHTISYSALTGGGRNPKPGEISLAHNGVLFLDELPEFQKKVLENLRQPLEDKKVTISRVHGNVTYPSKFMLIASMNPCPCGYSGVPGRCRCTENEISKYVGKISGPLLDRIDIHVEAPSVKFADLQSKKASATSAQIKKRIVKAHTIQRQRYENTPVHFNSELSVSQIETFCKIDQPSTSLIQSAFDRLNLSARAYHRILKVARTIADLQEEENIRLEHVAEAIQYRTLDRSYWT